MSVAILLTTWHLHLFFSDLQFAALQYAILVRQCLAEAHPRVCQGPIMPTVPLEIQLTRGQSTLMVPCLRPVGWHTAGNRMESSGLSMTLVEQTKSLPFLSRETRKQVGVGSYYKWDHNSQKVLTILGQTRVL